MHTFASSSFNMSIKDWSKSAFNRNHVVRLYENARPNTTRITPKNNAVTQPALFTWSCTNRLSISVASKRKNFSWKVESRIRRKFFSHPRQWNFTQNISNNCLISNNISLQLMVNIVHYFCEEIKFINKNGNYLCLNLIYTDIWDNNMYFYISKSILGKNKWQSGKSVRVTLFVLYDVIRLKLDAFLNFFRWIPKENIYSLEVFSTTKGSI